jgi:3-oxoacyl-[acyl-carrier-protein] synthase III
MLADAVIEIIGQGAWNGGTVVDNSAYEGLGMAFKGGVPVTRETIEERIGVRTRVAAPVDERIGVSAMRDLLATSAIDPARIKVLIAATNVGEDKHDPGPLCRHPYELIRGQAPGAWVLDLYAGCPGFNVAVEALFRLSLAGELRPGDLSVVVGAENIHRAKAFRPGDTANIIFGDDALATLLETGGLAGSAASGRIAAEETLPWTPNFLGAAAEALAAWAQQGPLEGVIVDNRMGRIEHRVPATGARIQQAVMERLYPAEAAAGAFRSFRSAMELYARQGKSFAFDVMFSAADPRNVQRLARAYTAAGGCRRVAALYLAPGEPIALSLVEGGGGAPPPAARQGVLGAATRSHGCFAGFIEAQAENGEPFGVMDGKGVFLYATRGAAEHLGALLAAHGLKLQTIDLLVEHQANFAMLPLTLEQLFADSGTPGAVADFLADKMVTNIHLRGNCSVVCMQRLPYDLERGALAPDTIQGFAVNRSLERLRQARLILYDSVGAGMTRSSFLRRRAAA